MLNCNWFFDNTKMTKDGYGFNLPEKPNASLSQSVSDTNLRIFFEDVKSTSFFLETPQPFTAFVHHHPMRFSGDMALPGFVNLWTSSSWQVHN